MISTTEMLVKFFLENADNGNAHMKIRVNRLGKWLHSLGLISMYKDVEFTKVKYKKLVKDTRCIENEINSLESYLGMYANYGMNRMSYKTLIENYLLMLLDPNLDSQKSENLDLINFFKNNKNNELLNSYNRLKHLHNERTTNYSKIRILRSNIDDCKHIFKMNVEYTMEFCQINLLCDMVTLFKNMSWNNGEFSII